MSNKITDFVVLMEFIASEDMQSSVYWTQDLSVTLDCSDSFSWGTADAEPLTIEQLPILKQAIIDAEYDAELLYCARVRKMRPQGAMYEYIDEKKWDLFNACGPEREIDFLNPKLIPERTVDV